uniref:V-type proton ATPase subunit G n=1 Tax=Ficedula albicollis TaxID=59894 RepID=A0A803V0G6_FICAL
MHLLYSAEDTLPCQHLSLTWSASGKGKRLKQAKEEATAEIDHYRLQREKEFRNKETNVMGSQGNLSAKIEEQTTEAIRNLTSSYHRNMENMMKKLLSTICDISPEIHPNFRPAV